MLNTIFLYSTDPNLTYQVKVHKKDVSSAATIHPKEIRKHFIRFCIFKSCGISVASSTMKKDSYGKPYIADNLNIHYNISHSNGLVACIVCHSPIGIDIEKIRDFNLNDKMSRFFSVTEWNLLHKRRKNNNRLFFRLWTCKESYTKYLGLGMLKAFSSFSIIRFKKSCIVEDYVGKYVVPIKLTTIKYKKEFYITVCSDTIIRKTPAFVTTNDIENFVKMNAEIYE